VGDHHQGAVGCSWQTGACWIGAPETAGVLEDLDFWQQASWLQALATATWSLTFSCK